MINHAVNHANLVEVGDGDGNTVVHKAIIENRIEDLEMMKENYPDEFYKALKVRNRAGQTPYVLAFHLANTLAYDVFKDLQGQIDAESAIEELKKERVKRANLQ